MIKNFYHYELRNSHTEINTQKREIEKKKSQKSSKLGRTIFGVTESIDYAATGGVVATDFNPDSIPR